MNALDPYGVALVFLGGVLLGALLLAAGALAGYWISARSRGEERPMRGEPEPPEIEQEETL